jgi:hypothetical protein
MSDIFQLDLSYHVFTVDGDLYVSDSNAGDKVLVKLAEQYPDATVIVEDRQSQEALSTEVSLTALLQAKETFLSIGLETLGCAYIGGHYE